MPQLHRKLGRDLVVGEIVEKLQRRAEPTAEHKHGALTLHADGHALSGVAPIVIMRARPDMLEPLLARQGTDRPGLALDDRVLHALRRAAVGEVAIAVEEPPAAVDHEREEDA